jgi:hypothetical protein
MAGPGPLRKPCEPTLVVTPAARGRRAGRPPRLSPPPTPAQWDRKAVLQAGGGDLPVLLVATTWH